MSLSVNNIRERGSESKPGAKNRLDDSGPISRSNSISVLPKAAQTEDPPSSEAHGQSAELCDLLDRLPTKEIVFKSDIGMQKTRSEQPCNLNNPLTASRNKPALRIQSNKEV